MPELAPVTIATFPFKRFIVSSPQLGWDSLAVPSMSRRWHFPFVRISLQMVELEFGIAER
jgi:hypothetical protein